ncbi:DUF11 domain-containing protein [Kitasatospora sp. MMS16-BH015]|uniref:DUF11 domain-containing protein n=1 Tax=Kitasatospora sp. MMS16-BH015 TaxID=2018025 RepID=UPI00131A59CE|nr:DUF11 domain-containing protein [Kitasatospora sp. MMS16-BH015]
MPVPVVVAVHRDTASPQEGEKVTYRIDITNRTAIDYPAAVIAQRMPGGMRAVSVSDGGTAQGKEVSWGVHLAPSATVHRRLTAVMGKQDRSAQARSSQDAVEAAAELSTTTCFRPDTEARPMGCGTDQFARAEGSGSGSLWIGAAGGALALAAGAVGGYLLLRRRGTGGVTPATG